MEANELKVGNWIKHRGYSWRISEIKNEHVAEWDLLIVLNRDDLEKKEIMLKNGSWYPGVTTVTSILRIKSNEIFELCDDDIRQFEWMKRS